MPENLAISKIHVRILLDLMAKAGSCRVREVEQGLYEIHVKETGGYTRTYSFSLNDQHGLQEEKRNQPKEKEPVFTPSDASAAVQSEQDAKERVARSNRQTALMHTCELAKTGASKFGHDGYTAEELLAYADKLASFLQDGTLPDSADG